MKTDTELLEGYARHGSEQDFRELVERRINLVHSAALRESRGNISLAEDITQAVFTELARRADSLVRHPALAGWLYTCVRRVAANVRRAEDRRHRREQEAFTMNELLSPDPNDKLWQQLRPELDDVMHELDDEDRTAVVLRFFEGRSLKEVGLALGLNENAARMRVERSLEKLRLFLSRRGVKSTAATLAASLAFASTSNASAALASTVAASALSSAALSGPATLFGSVKVKLAAACGAVVLTAGLVVWQQGRSSSGATTGAAPSGASPPVSAAVSSDINAQNNADSATTAAKETASSPKMILHVTETESGLPLSQAKVHLAYFQPSGPAKIMKKVTDAQGSLAVDMVQSPFNCLNLFVAAQGHAPKTISWSFAGSMPGEYSLKLPTATGLAGVVKDEAGKPIAGANIEFDVPAGIDASQQENIEFGPDTAVRTDTNGHWFSSMIPTTLDRVSLHITGSNYAELDVSLRPDTADATNSVLTMAAGFDVTGVVTDLNGLAIPNANIRQVRLNSEGEAKTTTDALGNFVFKNMPAGDLMVAVQAEGFAPAVKTIKVNHTITPLQFQLGPGSLLRGHVIDENGSPVSNAEAKTEGDVMAFRKIVWSEKTGATGKFSWASAPQEPLLYTVSAPGFAPEYRVPLSADGTDHEIKLTHLTPGKDFLQITGTAVDAESGQPLDGFTVRLRRVEPDWVVPLEFATLGQDGKFALSAPAGRLHSIYQFELEKDGHIPVLSSNLLTKDGNQTLTFKLQKGSGPAGVALLPSGEPAANATVYFCTTQSGVRLDSPGHVQKGVNTTSYLTQTDAAGRFSLAAAPAPQGLIIIHDNGFALTSLAAVAANSNITLQAWGRIEGRLVLGSQPITNETIFAGHQIQRHDEQGRHFGYMTYDYQTTTDAAGNFTFEKVPPGPCEISRRNLDHQVLVRISSGTTSQVTLGGSGTSVVGDVTVPEATNPIDWSTVWVKLTSNAANPPGPRPLRESFSSAAAFEQAWQAWRAAIDAETHVSEACDTNGAFTLPDVPAGVYEMRIELRDNKHNSVSATPSMGINPIVASLEREVTVGQDPLDLGGLVLISTPQNDVAQ
jgi:RNA polymerase sigma factor (sigma-70 family)